MDPRQGVSPLALIKPLAFACAGAVVATAIVGAQNWNEGSEISTFTSMGIGSNAVSALVVLGVPLLAAVTARYCLADH